MRNGYCKITIKMTAGLARLRCLQRPTLRGPTGAFASRLFGIDQDDALGPWESLAIVVGGVTGSSPVSSTNVCDLWFCCGNCVGARTADHDQKPKAPPSMRMTKPMPMSTTGRIRCPQRDRALATRGRLARN